jgi:predicted ATP-binding protein involved in virulence
LNTLQAASAPRQARRASMSETTTIKFEGLKGVGSVELNLRADQRVYVFIGTNGVGKTKVLEGLFQRSFFSNTHVNKQSKLQFDNHLVSTSAGLVLPSVSVQERHNLPVLMIGSNFRSNIERAQQQNYQIGTFEDRRLAHIKSQIVAIQSDMFSSIAMHENISDWFVSRAQSGNPYQKEADNRSVEIDTLLSTLAKVDSRFDASFMEIAGANNVSLKISGVVTELSHLSSGFASLVKMLQAIIAGYANFTNEKNLTHVKGIVLIDEIESHLHIEWQSKIIPLLKELFPNTTFYVATHSALVLTQLQQGEAYLLKRDEADGVVRSEMIKAPDNQSLADLLNASFKVNLNELKKKQLLNVDQSAVKQKMLAMLSKSVGTT